MIGPKLPHQTGLTSRWPWAKVTYRATGQVAYVGSTAVREKEGSSCPESSRLDWPTFL